ncbi:hypothetical protein FB639_002902 [Coemansia asiatica]|nr:hypothetical protein FB639_002902 [Coemansia asiatica]
MREPPPRRSKFSKFYINADDVDYNMKSSLGGKNGYPCRNTNSGPVQGTLVAGQDLKVFFDGIATKQGGDCQFAISYDNGTSFAVIWDKLGNCFLDTVNGGYEVPVPDKLPATKSAIFAWSWIPAVGDRSYYMNCADVRVENYGKQQAYTGKELLVVNVPGKPTLQPAKMGGNDTLPELLESRPLITVGEPVEPTDGSGSNGSKDDSAQAEDGNVDEQSSGGDDEQTDPGTVVLYVSESTTTSTEVVYVSEFVTEEDSRQAMYTYGAGIQTRGQLFTTLGPYVKPLFETNVGLTIVPDSAETPTSSASGMVFTDDLVSGKAGASAKWLGLSESLNFIPPSTGAQQTHMAPPTPTSKSADILLLGSSSKPFSASSGTGAMLSGGSNGVSDRSSLLSMLPDSTFAAGTPLFATSGGTSLQPSGNSASASASAATAAAGFTDPKLGPLEASDLVKHNTITTNRPDFKSITDQANANIASHFHPLMSATPYATTMINTTTKDGKPVLQVVVSMVNTPIPSSLTLSY